MALLFYRAPLLNHDMHNKMCSALTHAPPGEQFPQLLESESHDHTHHNMPRFLCMVVENARLWPNGKKLRVKFLQGPNELHKLVKKAATEWETYANISFDIVSEGTSDIRISFDLRDGNWSVVGNAALDVPDDKCTMNLSITKRTPWPALRRTVLHEFGHVLGCIHEHCSPSANIAWNVEAVYDYYYKKFGWSKRMVEANVLQKYPPGITQFSPVDVKSIMMYPFEGSLTCGGFSSGDNLDLSVTDIEFIQMVYPKLNR